MNEMLLESILPVEEGREGKASRTFCSCPTVPGTGPGAVWNPGKLSKAQCFPQALVPTSAQWLARLSPSLHPPCEVSALLPMGEGTPGPGTSCQHRILGKWQEAASPPWAGGRREINTNGCLVPVATTRYANLVNVFMRVRFPEFQSWLFHKFGQVSFLLRAPTSSFVKWRWGGLSFTQRRPWRSNAECLISDPLNRTERQGLLQGRKLELGR